MTTDDTQLTTYTGRDLLPDPLELIAKSGRAESTIRLYCGVLAPVADKITDTAALSGYAATLSESRRRTLKSAVSLWARECTRELESNVTPATLAITQATVMRLKRLADAIKTSTPRGQKAHTWLSQTQIDALYQACQHDGLQGMRDSVAVGLMVSTGIRRAELCALQWSHIVKQPYEGELCAVLSVVQGKGGRDRAIPLTTQMEALLDTWAERSGRRGYIVRAVRDIRAGRYDKAMSLAAVHNLVKKRGALANVPSLAPHDLRRSFAQAVWEASGDLLLTSALLGHSSIETTRRYLELDAKKQREAVQVIKWGNGGE
ncbi:MAG: tyrosine-type recombinase/integrase [Anaerolineae bacterium]|nr:tyrosine-type recombinase/integrase [Anaerolineae bacterium]